MTGTWNYADPYAYMGQLTEGLPPVIICLAANGGIQGKEYCEALPETAEELAESVGEAYDAGASMVHIHARDPETIWKGATTPEVWYDANRRLRERCPEIIINNTTGGDLWMDDEGRLSCLDANPEIASLNLAPDMSKFRLKPRGKEYPHPRPEINYDDCMPFSYKQISHFAAEMKKREIKPELEVYHPGCGWVLNDLIAQGLIEPPYWIQTVMGYQTSSWPTVDNVVHIVREFPIGSVWLCSGIGPHQLPMTTLATLMGGHVRVGLEDNVYYRRGEKATSNRQLVERAVRIVHELNREIATPAQAREMLGLSPNPSQYS
jgi:3-keto-5-aminohexanoate cleavage enzyme